MIEALYIYIEKENISHVTKYGMKLSEYSNKVINKKNGISAYLSPMDSSKYLSEEYTCLRVTINGLNSYIYDKNCIGTQALRDFFTNAENYILGKFENPRAIICSTILPENMSIYNKVRDFPILIENSSSYYYENFILDMMQNGKFSLYEIYQMLLVYGEQKGIFNSKDISTKLKIYTDPKTNRKYTRRKNE